jgi:hypothetical protein
MTIRNAIYRGARDIYLNNGTCIVHLDHGQTYDAVCPPKKIDGINRYRWIFCRITRVGGLEHKEELYQMDKYKDILHYDFILSERDMNYYISLCGGIDEYRTDYWAKGWMYY